jgi:hypothetical protein
VANYKVPLDTFSHQDFVYGKDAYSLVYPEILKNMAKYKQTV